MNYKLVLFSSAILWVLSCQPDENMIVPQTVQPTTNIDSRLIPYFDNFIAESSLRNIDLAEEVYALSAEIIEIDEENIAGQCNFNSLRRNHIIIDKEFFNNAPFLFNEFIIFHELGHCVLYRDHLEASFANGICTSMMRSGVEECRDNYRASTRSAYIDELFSMRDEI